MKNLTAAEVAALSHDEKLEYLRLLDELEATLAANPLQGYHPHGKQVVFHTARTRYKAFLGGNRSGKTTAGVVDDLIQACDLDAIPDHLRPYKRWFAPFKCRIVVPDFTNTAEAVFEAIRRWVPPAQLVGNSFDQAYSKQDRRLEFKNGSFFEFLTYEQKRDKMGGTARHRIHFDEEPPKEIYEECRARTIDYGGDLLFTMTPLMGMTWMYDGVYERRGEKDVTVVEVATDENLHNLNEDALNDMWATLTEEEIDARRKGLFVHFGGLVLPKFEEERHVVPALELDGKVCPALAGQEIFVGIDPGITRGGVVWAAFDRDNHMLVFDEFYPKNLTIEQTALVIHARNAYWGVKPLYIVDPSARNRQFNTGENVETELIRCGIPPIRGNNDRFSGIMQLRRRLEHRKLTVTANCIMWLRERARWRVAEDEESGEDKSSEGDSFKTAGPDHLMDPTRYVAMHRAWGWTPPMPQQRRGRPAYQPDFEGPYDPYQQFHNPNEAPMGPMS